MELGALGGLGGLGWIGRHFSFLGILALLGLSSLIPLFEVYNYVNEIVFFTERFSFLSFLGGWMGSLDALLSVFITVMMGLWRTMGEL